MRDERKNKFKISFADCMGWIIGILGVIATIISLYTAKICGLSVALVAVTVTEILIIFIWTGALIDKSKRKNEISKLLEKIEEHEFRSKESQQNIEDLKKEMEKRHDEMMQKIAVISMNLKNASKLNNDFCTRIPRIAEKSYHILEVFFENETINGDNKFYQAELQRSYEEFAIGLLDVYRRYTSNFLNQLVNLEEAYLAVKGCQVQVSATIKLFDEPYFSDRDNRNEICVYTAFRDKITYEKHHREIGEELYTIDGNVDFVHCLKKDHFVINNVKKGEPSYMNEHKDFDRYYNCTIVVAIRTKLPGDSFKHFGYLCCDCLNDDQEKVEVFDVQAAQFLFAMAKQYATYFDTLDANWYDRTRELQNFPKSFLKLVYDHTFTGIQKRHAEG